MPLNAERLPKRPSTMFKRHPTEIGEILLQAIRESRIETPLLQRRLINSWEAVAGGGVARYTTEKFIRGQVLFVRLDNPALRAELGMQRSKLVERLNQSVGTRLITDIKFY